MLVMGVTEKSRVDEELFRKHLLVDSVHIPVIYSIAITKIKYMINSERDIILRSEFGAYTI